MSGSEFLLWSYGQFEKMTFFPPDPIGEFAEIIDDVNVKTIPIRYR